MSNLAGELAVYKKIVGLSIAHTCQIKGVFKNKKKGKMYILLDYCEYSLSEFIFSLSDDKADSQNDLDGLYQHDGLDEETCRFIARGLLQGLKELHEKYFILHNDIKEHNIMMTGSNLQIIDFGVAQV